MKVRGQKVLAHSSLSTVSVVGEFSLEVGCEGSGLRIFPASLPVWCLAGLARPGTRPVFADAALQAGGSDSVVRLGELVMIMELHRQGLSPVLLHLPCCRFGVG